MNAYSWYELPDDYYEREPSEFEKRLKDAVENAVEWLYAAEEINIYEIDYCMRQIAEMANVYIPPVDPLTAKKNA